MADTGFGTTITFQSGWFASVTSAQWGGIKRESIDTTHMASTSGWATFMPSDIKDAGELTVEMLFDADTTFITPIGAAAESVTFTFPIETGHSTAATWACSGFLTSFEIGVPMDDKMTSTAKIKFSGVPTLTAGT